MAVRIIMSVVLGVGHAPVEAAQPAVRSAVTVQVAQPPPTFAPEPPGWAQCPEYYNLALDVGWPEEQMRTVMYVMHRESRCDPHATGSNVHGKHAQGLLQLLGWDCPPDGCYDPTSNLTKALELWHRSGWCPWVLRGDPVTGKAC